jgi:hypothetical protein
MVLSPSQRVPRRGNRALGFLIALCLWFPLSAGAQKASAERTRERTAETTLTEAKWSEEEITKGLIWRRDRFENLFGSKQSINILDVDLNRGDLRISFAWANSRRQPVSSMAERAGAIAAVNGTFFDKERGRSLCFLRVNGTTIAPGSRGAFDVDAGALTVSAGGETRIAPRPDGGWKVLETELHAMAAKPLLIHNGEPAKMAETSLVTQRHPRTAVGLTKDNHLLLVAVDGRMSAAAGMSCRELTRTMLALGCREALNLDGGGSTTMWIRGKPRDGVVNKPSGDGTLFHWGARPCANAVVVFRSSPEKEALPASQVRQPREE